MSNIENNKILLIEDDKRLANLVAGYLKKNGYNVIIENHGTKGIEAIRQENPDLVILDLMLPGDDGFSICRTVRNEYSGFIMMVTANEDDIDQVAGLELGADDYVKKPVEPRILLARIRSLLRRVNKDTTNKEAVSSEESVLTFGKLRINNSHRNVFLGDNEVLLTTIEFDMLWFFASNPGKILSRDDLSNKVRGTEYDGLNRSIDISVSRLRKKLEDDTTNPYKIKTVWGSGYLFVDDAWE